MGLCGRVRQGIQKCRMSARQGSTCGPPILTEVSSSNTQDIIASGAPKLTGTEPWKLCASGQDWTRFFCCRRKKGFDYYRTIWLGMYSIYPFFLRYAISQTFICKLYTFSWDLGHVNTGNTCTRIWVPIIKFLANRSLNNRCHKWSAHKFWS